MQLTKWDKKYYALAEHVATWSKDIKRQVGCVIVKDNNILSNGYNGLPRGVDDSIEDRYVRPKKLFWTEHAERNAIYNATRNGLSTIGATAYCTYFPCADCARGLIQIGIIRIVTTKPNFNEISWGTSWKESQQMLNESNIQIDFIL